MRNVIWFANERISLEDIGDATGTLPFAEQQRLTRVCDLPPGRATGLPMTSARVLSGFGLAAWVVDTSTSLTMSAGTGFFPVYEQGKATFGAVLGDNLPNTRILDVSTMGDGIYGLWVRFVRSGTDTENRHFWNAAEASEYQSSAPTRLETTWEITTTPLGSIPGHGEWVLLYFVQVLAGKVHAVVDYRHLYYEGSVPDSYVDEWGSAIDRNANRALYGITDQHRWAQALRRQLADIIGAGWYTSTPRNLTAMAAEHKVSGVHSAVTADSVNLSAGAPGLITTKMLTVQPRAGSVEGILLDAAFADENAPLLEVYQRADVSDVRMLSINRQGMIGAPAMYIANMCLAKDSVLANVVPGNAWGSYFTPAPAAAPAIGTEASILDPVDGGGMNVKIVTGGTALSFAGVRTGGQSNTQASAGWYLLSRRPKCLVAFWVHSWADCGVSFGFWNDLAPLDTDPSRALINVDASGAGGMIFGSDGSSTLGASNLTGGAPSIDTLYVFELDVISSTKIRVRCRNTGTSETFTKVIGAPMIEVNGGVPVRYSFFAVITQTAAAAKTMYLKRFHLTDESYIGPV
jgi:hypothetical protein